MERECEDKKRYFVNGKEISYSECMKIKEENNRLIASNDISDWKNIQFITVV